MEIKIQAGKYVVQKKADSVDSFGKPVEGMSTLGVFITRAEAEKFLKAQLEPKRPAAPKEEKKAAKKKGRKSKKASLEFVD